MFTMKFYIYMEILLLLTIFGINMGNSASPEIRVDLIRKYPSKWTERAIKWMEASQHSSKLATECKKDVDAVMFGLLTQHQFSTLMFDAQGVAPPGYYKGNLFWPGFYDQCVRISGGVHMNFTGPWRSVTGKHCMAEFKDFIRRGAIGACFPSSCNATDARILIHDYAWTDEPVPENATVWCVENKDISKDPAAIVGLFIVFVFVILVVSGTIVDLLEEHKKTKTSQGRDNSSIKDNDDHDAAAGQASNTMELEDPNHPDSNEGENVKETNMDNQNITQNQQAGKPAALKIIILSFSLYTNGRNLLSAKHPAGSFTCLHGIRFLSMAWIILGHTWVLGINLVETVTTANLWAYEEGIRNENWFHSVINQMSLAVEAFFIMSGFLGAVSFLKGLKRSNGKVTLRAILKFYLHRYMRLTPVYAMLIMIFTLYYPYMGQGPLHKPETLQSCKQSWFFNLLYINNVVGLGCFGWTWYLACDFQFYVFSPLFLVPLYKFKILGKVIVGVALFATVVLNLGLSYLAAVGRLDHYSMIYIKFYSRIGPYLQGMLLGYLFFSTKFKFKLKRVVIVVCWLAALAMISLMVFVPYTNICKDCKPWHIAGYIIIEGVQRNLFSLGVVWIIFACISGYGSFINTFLSWNFFVPLSRLTYVSYLFHPLLMFYIMYGRTTMFYISYWNMIYLFCGHLLLTLGFSAIITLMFEIPMLGVEKVILPPKKRQ